jgi:hypothetical protein
MQCTYVPLPECVTILLYPASCQCCLGHTCSAFYLQYSVWDWQVVHIKRRHAFEAHNIAGMQVSKTALGGSQESNCMPPGSDTVRLVPQVMSHVDSHTERLDLHRCCSLGEVALLPKFRSGWRQVCICCMHTARSRGTAHLLWLLFPQLCVAVDQLT